jgi:hypothetical protein
MSCVKGHLFGGMGRSLVALHHRMAGNEMRLEQNHTSAMRKQARVLVILEGYVKGSVMAK